MAIIYFHLCLDIICVPLIFGLLLISYRANYNELRFTIILVIVAYVISKMARWLWVKEITFDRLAGKIYYKTNIPGERYAIDFFAIEWSKREETVEDKTIVSYCIKNEELESKKCLFSVDSTFDLVAFFNGYMNSDPEILNDLVEYDYEKVQRKL